MVAFFVVSASLLLRYPGLHYDEALFTNAALGVDKTTFVTAHWWGVPVLLMPYIGALKSYIFIPIFQLLPTNVFVMRGVNIIMMAGFLWLTYSFVSRRASQRISLLTLALLCSNASIIIFGRTDFGPIIIEHIAFVAALWFLFAYVEKRSLHYLVLAIVALLVGLYNKLNFLWYINALYAASVVAFYQARKKLLDKRVMLVAAAGYILAVAYYLFISNHYQLKHGLHLGHLSYIVKTGTETLGGQWFFTSLLGADASSSLSYWLCIVQFAAIAIAARGILKGRHRSLFIVSTVIFVLMLAQITITPEATAGWHYLTLQPFWAILVALSADYFLSKVSKRAFVYAIFACLCLVQTSVYFTHLTTLKHTRNYAWSKSIYNLADYSRATPGSFIAADWGLQTELITLDPTPQKYIEAFGPINPKNQVERTAAINNYFSPHGKRVVYIITHPEAFALFPDNQKALLTIADSIGNVQKAKEIADEGRVTFIVYRVNLD